MYLGQEKKKQKSQIFRQKYGWGFKNERSINGQLNVVLEYF